MPSPGPIAQSQQLPQSIFASKLLGSVETPIPEGESYLEDNSVLAQSFIVEGEGGDLDDTWDLIEQQNKAVR